MASAVKNAANKAGTAATAGTLQKCVPEYWLWMPKPLRFILGWITITIFSLSFLIVPICSFLLVPAMWRNFPYFCSSWVALLVISMLAPQKEWVWVRYVGQLWYEIFDFSGNLSQEKVMEMLDRADKEQFILAMHPHGIIPIQAILWTAYCHQFLVDKATGRSMYGFGAVADVVGYLPILRNILGWLSGGSADYKTLRDGLVEGKHAIVNRSGRKPRHLYILPGGVAEIFVSTPGKNVIVFKDRKGLVKLSLETGAMLTPCYVFGGTDFYNNLATHGGIFSSLSRKLKMGLTIFWGPYGLPIPFAPRCTIVVGDPIPVKKWEGEGRIPAEMMDELHNKFMDEMRALFNKYKEAAGYADCELEIV